MDGHLSEFLLKVPGLLQSELWDIEICCLWAFGTFPKASEKRLRA